MAKETKAPAARKAKVSKNPDELVFEYMPFYNMANVRKAAISLIVRSSSDPAKVDAIRETLKTLLAFLDARASHAAEVRASDVAAAEAAAAEAVRVAAEHKERDAVKGLADAQSAVEHFGGILKALRGE